MPKSTPKARNGVRVIAMATKKNTFLLRRSRRPWSRFSSRGQLMEWKSFLPNFVFASDDDDRRRQRRWHSPCPWWLDRDATGNKHLFLLKTFCIIAGNHLRHCSPFTPHEQDVLYSYNISEIRSDLFVLISWAICSFQCRSGSQFRTHLSIGSGF